MMTNDVCIPDDDLTMKEFYLSLGDTPIEGRICEYICNLCNGNVNLHICMIYVNLRYRSWKRKC